MDFYPYEAFDKNEAQEKLWEWIKKAFRDDDGVAYYRYPIFTKQGNLNREPDILILHREFGLWIFECKACYINNIKSIQGHEWQMNNWHDEFIMPVAQAEDQMFAIGDKLNRRETRGLIKCNFRVVLPNINKKAWEDSGFSNLPTVEGNVLVHEDLTPSSLRKYIKENSRSHDLADEQWQIVRSVLGGTLPNRPPRNIPTGTPLENPIRVIREIESQLKILDETQQKIAFEIPDGPQRLRGLAGTGKTVLLAKRAAKIHIKYPDWKIAFIFFTRSLYDQVTDLINLYYREMHPDNNEPNFKNLQILHSWGAKDQHGFYRKLAYACGKKPKSVNDVKNEIGNHSPAESFEYICNCLENES
jgi:superfamily I DNA and RNA helicase